MKTTIVVWACVSGVKFSGEDVSSRYTGERRMFDNEVMTEEVSLVLEDNNLNLSQTSMMKDMAKNMSQKERYTFGYFVKR